MLVLHYRFYFLDFVNIVYSLCALRKKHVKALIPKIFHAKAAKEDAKKRRERAKLLNHTHLFNLILAFKDKKTGLSFRKARLVFMQVILFQVV